jgi:hypothetical protein
LSHPVLFQQPASFLVTAVIVLFQQLFPICPVQGQIQAQRFAGSF